jgi:hypothetical protein
MAHLNNIENNDTTILNVEAVQIVVDGYFDYVSILLRNCGGEGTPFVVWLVQNKDLAWDHPASLETETAKCCLPAFMLLVLKNDLVLR